MTENISEMLESRNGLQKYRKDFSKQLLQIRLDNRFCDVDVHVGSQTFRAHKVILSAGSMYFHAMFCSGMMENDATIITLYDMDPNIFRFLLDFIYLGEITVTEENCQDLLYAADMIGLLPVVSMCVNFLQDQIKPYNCLGIYSCADTPNLKDLRHFAKDYIESKFCDVTKEDEFLELPYTEVQTWLKSEMINIISEAQVLEAALHWTEHNVTDRLQTLPQLLDDVRFPLINHTQMQDLFSRKVKNRCVVRAAREYLRQCDIPSTNIRSFPRKSTTRSIYVIGGYHRPKSGRWSDAISLKSVEKYDLYKKKWESFPSINYPRSKHSAVAHNRKIYVAGGEDDLLMHNTLEIFNSQTEEWTEGSSLNYPHCGFGMCVNDGKIFAVGGWIGTVLGDMIETYDIEMDSWDLFSKIQDPKFAFGVVEMEGLLYLVGGTDMHTGAETTSTDSFNPVTKEWTKLADMHVARSDFSLVALDGYLYAIGGFNDHDKELNCVERYDPEEDLWTFITPMSERRTAPSAVGLHGRLYVIGGHCRNSEDQYSAPVTLDSVECYDPLTETWTNLPSLTQSRSEASAVVM